MSSVRRGPTDGRSDADFAAIFDRLFKAFGPQAWWPGDGAFETMLGAILTQHTSWSNVETALDRFRRAGCLDPTELARLSDEHLAGLIRPAGTYRQKSRTVAGLLSLLAEFGGDVGQLLGRPCEELRARLLAVKGIGPETADCIVLYAAGYPRFVVDGYTRRIFGRLGLIDSSAGYGSIQRQFEAALPADDRLFNEYHALIVRLGKDICRAAPLCPRCPLADLCPRRGVKDAA